jgi:Raf kinase inhibitor-like YbhB/YbcL family protein
MKVAMCVVLVLMVVLAAVVLLAWRHALSDRRADAAYHAGLPNTLQVGSTSLPAGGEIPMTFTCRGSGVSPELDWKGGPDHARSYAVLMRDFDVPAPYLALSSFTHWLVYDRPGQQRQIQSAAWLPDGQFYRPPCPPLGRHRYAIRVYALDVPHLNLLTDDAAGLLNAMRGHVIAYGERVATAAH